MTSSTPPEGFHWTMTPEVLAADKAEFEALPPKEKAAVGRLIVDIETCGLDYVRGGVWPKPTALILYPDGSQSTIRLRDVTDDDMRAFTLLMNKARLNARGGLPRNGRKRRSLRRRQAALASQAAHPR